MSLKTLCTPRPSVFEADRRATVLSLDSFLKDQVDGRLFFEENYFTGGMLNLVDRAFRHLSGSGAGSSVFQLSQAMGGGKTHSMISLGLLARDPSLRQEVFAQVEGGNPAPNLGACRVVGFNGRNTDATGGVWGSIAKQLDKAEQFAQYMTPLLSAPGPQAWKELLGDQPLVIFLDELPPYLEYAVAVPVGNGNLATVTTAALANLFVAVTDMPNVCLVLSDLGGTNYASGQDNINQAVERAIQQVSSESRRIAVPITPVNPNGDELYHILRKRLFAEVAPKAAINGVASAYRDALREARNMDLTTTTPESLYARIQDSYPFHPDLRELVGKFKENEGFQQTRGVIRLMQMVVSHLWTSDKAAGIDLIHPYDLDLNQDEIASEVRMINPSLSEAIAHDIAHDGGAEVELIDETSGNNDASEAARLILVASLSTTLGAVHGLREFQLYDCLQRPGRDLSGFKTNVLDKLAIRAWYLHKSPDGRLFFKNQQNLAAKLRSTAQSLHSETVERMLRDRLADTFDPSLRDCYQVVRVLPPLDEVQLEQEKTTLVITRPRGRANGLPVSQDWQNWWQQQPYKNRVLFLSGSKDTYMKILDAARQQRALMSIEDELNAEETPPDDPQWRALDSLRDRIGLQFTAALKETFDQLVYPSLNSALRTGSIDLAFAGNTSGEATIKQTLKTVHKFTTEVSEDSFRASAEAKLFVSSAGGVVLWKDVKRTAATRTDWPLHKPSALDDLKAEAQRRGLWRLEGNLEGKYVRKGPFPPPAPSIEIRELSRDEDKGVTFLGIKPLHCDSIVYETGDSEPTTASSPVPTPAKFEAKGLQYKFLAFDSENSQRVSEVKPWTAELRLKKQLNDRGDHYEVELLAFPKANGVRVRYTTDGSSPTSSNAAVYDGPIRTPENCRKVCAVAQAPVYSLTSPQIVLEIPRRGEAERTIDGTRPARWQKQTKLDDSGSVWDLLSRLEQNPGVTTYDVHISAQSSNGEQIVDYAGALASGYGGPELKAVVVKLQDIVQDGPLRMEIGELGFPTGQALINWLKLLNQPFDLSHVSQD
ncbi:MAG: DUF499 domain-containing protein [Cyanobacteria bacterium MAG CAR3_bin_5]|nr:DUF499 domain-containing protein [Cyanobacteria bacterium MAG CAR3_bin_5]